MGPWRTPSGKEGEAGSSKGDCKDPSERWLENRGASGWEKGKRSWSILVSKFTRH